MKNTTYHFTTLWKTQAPLKDVWQQISDNERWPEWWKGVEKVIPIHKGNPDGTGAIKKFVWKSVLPYRLTMEVQTVHLLKNCRIEGKASGDLQGAGVWTFVKEKDGLLIRYEWKVETTKAWMNFVAPLARPILEWNHRISMQRGADGLARVLQSPVCQIESGRNKNSLTPKLPITTT